MAQPSSEIKCPSHPYHIRKSIYFNQRHVFGINRIKDNVFFLEENTILYPAGSNIVIYNIENNTQKFIQVPEHGEGISAVSVAADRVTMALAEASSNKPTISVYELSTFRKRKTIFAESNVNKEFVALSFSSDGRYLAAQMGGPEFLLCYYAWEKGKAIATIPSVAAGFVGNIKQISINPFDATEISVIGDGLFKIFRYSEGLLRSIRTTCPIADFNAHIWLQNNAIALGTSHGKVFIALDGALIQELDFSPNSSIISMVNITKGFVAAGAHGTIVLYSQVFQEVTKDGFEIKKRMQLPEQDSNIQTVSVSSSYSNIIISSEKNQIFRISMEDDGNRKEDEVKFETISSGFHHGPIKGMDSCTRKPFIVTCSTDKSIRIWNYLTTNCEQVKTFPEDIFSVSLHPSGLYILAGFSDKLRLMNILMDDLRTFREFPIRSCQECRFSNGGQFFAATLGNMIQIYSVWTFELLGVLKGHNGKVRSLYFTQDDSVLVSAGTDGAVYTWNTREFKRENEHILKTCSYSSAICTADGKTVYAVGIDHLLKEITESSVTRELTSSSILTQVVLSNSGRMMFAGTSTGSIKSFKYPLSELSDFQEHEAHSGAVTKLRISYDDQYLFSVSEDGCVYVFKIADKDEHSIKSNKAPTYSDEVLITKSDLEEKTVMMGELQRGLEELKLEHEYQLRLKDMNFNEKLKEITEKYTQEIEALKISASVLRTEKDKESVQHQEELTNMKSKHVQEIHDVETKYNSQLMEEYDKFEREQEQSNVLQKGWQKKMVEFEKEAQWTLSETQTVAETHLNAKASEINKTSDELKAYVKELEEMTRQNEEDIDTEVVALTNRYEKKVKAEREEAARLKGENGIMRKKFNTLNKDIEENKSEIARMAENEKKLQNVILGFEKDIQNLRKEMAERDEHIQEKERKVYDLKKRNQELEKFKFVLDFRIKELKEQVEPRENEIADMTSEIHSINIELDQLSREKVSLEEKISKLCNVLLLKKTDYIKEHEKVLKYNSQIKSFRVDLQDCIHYFQEPHLLKKSIENLAKKYGARESEIQNSKMSLFIKKECLEQQEFLREKISSLRIQTTSSVTRFKTMNVKSIMQNRSLIKEIETLRNSKNHHMRPSLQKTGIEDVVGQE